MEMLQIDAAPFRTDQNLDRNHPIRCSKTRFVSMLHNSYYRLMVGLHSAMTSPSCGSTSNKKTRMTQTRLDAHLQPARSGLDGHAHCPSAHSQGTPRPNR